MGFNQSTLYLTPLLYHEIGVDPEFINSILNTYLIDSEEEVVSDNKLLIHHKFQNNDDFLQYENKLQNSEFYCKTIDVNEDVVYIFKFPDKYKEDYINFKESKYSKINNNSKKIILQNLSKIYGKESKVTINELMKIKNILHKDKSLKETIEKTLNVEISDDQELGEHVDLDKETFKLNILNDVTGI